ncbi:MAG: hypothetical protein P8X96_16790 [Desulfobacteraceae bacterium]
MPPTGILAAIAIPQFATYRKRALNAKSDYTVGVIKSAEAAVNQDVALYGSSFGGVNPAGGGGGVMLGPAAAAAVPAGQVADASAAAFPASLQNGRGAGVAVNNGGVSTAAGCAVPAGTIVQAQTDNLWLAYTSWAYTAGGNRAFLIESDSENTIYYVQNMTWPNLPAVQSFGQVVVQAVAPGGLENEGVNGGGEGDYNGGLWTALQ